MVEVTMKLSDGEISKLLIKWIGDDLIQSNEEDFNPLWFTCTKKSYSYYAEFTFKGYWLAYSIAKKLGVNNEKQYYKWRDTANF
jgi:hypothetical protein